MKIGVTGDTHGSQIIIRRLLANAPAVDCWLHTGDFARDAVYLAKESGLPVTVVSGNCDAFRAEAKMDEFLPFEGHFVWLTHGHKYLRIGVEELAFWGERFEADVVVFGHTHVPLISYVGNRLLLNPGSPVLPRSSEGPTFAVLTLKNGIKPQAEIINLPRL